MMSIVGKSDPGPETRWSALSFKIRFVFTHLVSLYLWFSKDDMLFYHPMPLFYPSPPPPPRPILRYFDQNFNNFIFHIYLNGPVKLSQCFSVLSESFHWQFQHIQRAILLETIPPPRPLSTCQNIFPNVTELLCGLYSIFSSVLAQSLQKNLCLHCQWDYIAIFEI